MQSKESPSKFEEEGTAWLTIGLEKASERLERYLKKNGVIHPDDLEEKDIIQTDDPKVKKIDKQAIEDEYLSGKWIIKIEPERIDDVWKVINDLVSDDLIWGAQVTTKWIRERRDEDDHVLKVYTPNYFDEDDVLRVRELLKDKCDIYREIVYKPDIYNILGIYSGRGEGVDLPKENRYVE